MSAINFFSEDIYLHLPNAANPKVILAVSNVKASKASYKLYNPFSFKARILKKISQFLFVNFNSLMLRLVKTKTYKKSDFIKYLEHELNLKFTVSIYNATEQDKVVLQLQCSNQIYGYLKFPLNKIGVDRINTEIKAIEVLSEKNIIAPYILNDIYNGNPYVILPEIKGEISDYKDQDIENVISKFKKEKQVKLIEHKRIRQLYHDVETLQLKFCKLKLDEILKNSTVSYYEAFEHGDFAPWNIVNTEKGLVPFDFEFFVENGLEYLDLIKYHFQVGRLLKKKNYRNLFVYLCDKIRIVEVNYMVCIFLIKEIVSFKKMDVDYKFHHEMLNYICE